MTFATQTDTIQSSIITVTPELAHRFLATSAGNRRISRLRVQTYAAQMREPGKWKIGPELQFNVLGELVDGHHRLNAVILCGMPVQFRIATGIPADSISAIDLGQSRTYEQVSKMRGVGFTRRHFAIARFVKYGVTTQKGSSYLSYSDAEQAVLDYETAVNFAVMAGQKRRYVTATVLAVIARAFYTQDHDRLVKFVEILASGLTDSEEDWAAVRLRNWIIDADSLGHSIPKSELYHRAETAVKHFCDRKPVKTLKPTLEELFPVPPLK